MQVQFRVWWLMAIAASLWMCGTLTRNIWDDWNEKPVTLTVSEQKEPVAVIPFPQVTICPEIKTAKRKFDITKSLNSLPYLSDVEMQQLNALAHICPRIPEHYQGMDNFTNASIYNVIRSLALEVNESADMCVMARESLNWNCELYPLLTSEGICFTFNVLDSSILYTDEMETEMIKANILTNPNWYFETPFDYKWEEDFMDFPFGYHEYGRKAGLLLGAKVLKENMEHQCKGFDQGYKLVVNMPGDVVRTDKNFIRVPSSEKTDIKIKPTVTYTSEELRHYDPNQRQCYFKSERQLRFYKMYSQSNCDVECLANFTKIECGCVTFSMPRDKNTQICGVAKIACYKLAEQKIASDAAKSFRDNCHCLPSCTTVEYHFEVKRSEFTFDSETLDEEEGEEEEEKENMLYGRLLIFYGDQYMETIKRNPVYTYPDFLANCGGLLGLFLGVSALSIFEIVYFFTLRLLLVHQAPESSEAMNFIKRILNKIRFVRGIQRFFTELCDNSNIHGILYFTRRNLHWSERLSWVIAIGTSVWLCYLLIYRFWVNWYENLVTLSFSKSTAAISTIPFPSITICSDIKSMVHSLNETFGGYINDDRLDSNLIEHHGLVQTSSTLRAYVGAPVYTFVNESTELFDAIRRISPQLNETFEKCCWGKELVDCAKYFVPIFTSEGLCFSSNALKSHQIYTDEMAPGMKIVESNPNVYNWDYQNGYTEAPSDKDYPLRLADSADANTFKISLSIDDDQIDPFYKTYINDFKVSFTTPGDAVDLLKSFITIPLSGDVRISINTKLTTTSNGLASYTPNQRQCYFNGERQLRFFKIYTQFNCEMECLANHLIQKFGCVIFSLPRDNSTSICAARYTGYDVPDELVRFWTDNRILRANKMEPIRESCNCLPTCTTIEYSAYVDSTKLNIHNEEHGTQHAEITISFGSQPVETVERIETYTFAEFLATCGGLLGLFMGISALSIIELIYFCTLRWFWILRRDRNGIAIDQPETRVIDVIPFENL